MLNNLYICVYYVVECDVDATCTVFMTEYVEIIHLPAVEKNIMVEGKMF